MEAGRGGVPQAISGSMARSPKNLGVRKGRTVRLFAGYRPSMPPSISTLRDECWPTCLGQTARCKTRVRPNAHWALAPVFVSSASTIPLRTSRPEILNHPFPQNESAAEVLRFPRGSVASRQGQHIRWAEGRRDPPYKSARPPVHSSHPGSQFACRVLDPVQLLVHPGSPAPQQSAKRHQRQPVTQNLQDVRAASPWGAEKCSCRSPKTPKYSQRPRIHSICHMSHHPGSPAAVRGVF